MSRDWSRGAEPDRGDTFPPSRCQCEGCRLNRQAETIEDLLEANRTLRMEVAASRARIADLANDRSRLVAALLIRADEPLREWDA